MTDETISHFRIIGKLGAGGMGVVYKAVDTRLDRHVALKFLPDNMAHDPQALERFRREAHAASALTHPGICTIYDIGEQNRRPFIAMEFIDGETLRQHIHGQPLPLAQILDLGFQIADALDAAHSHGIIHRDIKPSNVFVTKRGQAKVLDFGLAKLVPKDFLQANPDLTPTASSQESVSVVGIISGTPGYMSPEQVRGDDLDARTDIFAFGLLLYEMSSGRQAFTAKTGGAIIEAILTRSPPSIRTINAAVPAELEEIIAKCLEKDRNSRYASAAEVRSALQHLKRVTESGEFLAAAASLFPEQPQTQSPSAATGAPAPAPASSATIAAVSAPPSSLPGRFLWKLAALTIAVLVIAFVVFSRLHTARRAQALTQTDTILLLGFTNKTDDPIFDDTLRQGLAAQLQQSPFLSLVSEQRIQQTLHLMGKSPETKLSPEIAGDLCQRLGSKAYLTGSISKMGAQYVIGVNAANCQTGDSLAQEQVTANGKENVLGALGTASTSLREKLGESLKTVQKLDTPIEQATTPSLEALQAYSLGRKSLQGKADYTAAIPLFERSIQLDPNFAMAYAILGTAYHNLGEKILSAQNTRKAYELRGRVSEWEKFYIDSHYHQFVTGDLEKARQTYELWGQIYPREQVPHNNLDIVFQILGQYDKALAESKEALRLGPTEFINYANAVVAHIHLNQLGEAQSVANEALSKNFDSGDLRLYLYQLAFLKHDESAMAQQIAHSAGKPGEENAMLLLEAETAAYLGKLNAARDFSRQAVAAAARAGEKEMAADCEAEAALWEALYGNAAAAKQRASSTLAQSSGHDAQYAAALTLAISGDSARARSIAEELEKRFPEDTIVRFNYLPTLRAQLALNSPGGAAKAIEALASATPYELGVPGGTTFWVNLYPVYMRGQAYLALRQGPQAAAEFQKILDWPGVAVNEPIAALAPLGLARSYALAGDSAKSRASYNTFLTLWQSADPSIPILLAAKSELASLK
jgi:eukaryotic-like serine/threonine-protein kinase